MKRVTSYCFLVHALLLAFLLATVLLAIEIRNRASKEDRMVEKYAPAMQRICDDLGVDIQINTFDDLLEAFDQIVFKPARNVRRKNEEAKLPTEDARPSNQK
jgi:hypothetical protein